MEEKEEEINPSHGYYTLRYVKNNTYKSIFIFIEIDLKTMIINPICLYMEGDKWTTTMLSMPRNIVLKKLFNRIDEKQINYQDFEAQSGIKINDVLEDLNKKLQYNSYYLTETFADNKSIYYGGSYDNSMCFIDFIKNKDYLRIESKNYRCIINNIVFVNRLYKKNIIVGVQ